MSGNHRVDRSKKLDKSMLDTHREFLDMDTDEEEFGRQETTEIEEELLPEPERPAYKTEELMILVHYVKELLVLPSLKESDWNESCYEIVREYFCNPVHDVLSIFYEDSLLNAALEIPKNSTDGFAYFLRPHWHIFTQDNFPNTISYGTINKNVNKSILKFMENVCAPIVVNYQSWPRTMQNTLFSSFNELLVHYMELIYKSEGVTILYIPRERGGLDFTVPGETTDCTLKKTDNITEEELEIQKEFRTRLENIVYHWIRQTRNAMRSVPLRNNITNLLEEVNFWTAKNSSLNNLHIQLLSSDARTIMKTLIDFRSPTVELFDKLIKTLRTSVEEASSNSIYLQILCEYSKNINILENADGSITKCLLVILFIWSESPYYNTTNNIEILCGSLSTQIINQCVSHINLNNTFETNPEGGIAIIEKCIRCCIVYKSLYTKVTKKVAPSINPNTKWNVREELVFNNVRTFIQRCHDVIDISKMLILYGRYNRAGLLGTPKNAEYEIYCHKMETIFNESLRDIRVSQASIFDVTDSSWLNTIKQFKSNVSQLENMTKNLIIDIFSRVKNVEEGTEALYAFSKFKNVNFLRDLLQKNWTKVWKIFHDEIEFCYITAMKLDKRNKELSCAVSLFLYLQKQHDIMINASYWLGNNVAEKCTLHEYKRVIKTLNVCRSKLIPN